MQLKYESPVVRVVSLLPGVLMDSVRTASGVGSSDYGVTAGTSMALDVVDNTDIGFTDTYTW